MGHVEADCLKAAPGALGGGQLGDGDSPSVSATGATIDSASMTRPGAASNEPAKQEHEAGPPLDLALMDDDEGTDLTDLVDVPDAEPTVFEDLSGEQCGFCCKFGHRSNKCPDAGAPTPPPAAALVETTGPTLVTPPRSPGPALIPPGALRLRGKSIPVGFRGRLTRVEKAEAIEYPEDVDRPRTREDCKDGPRPCPFVSCSHHLYLDVNPQTGTIKVNFPHLELWEMPETCSLDVADRGGVTLEEVGKILNLTRERIRQVEERGLEMMSEHADQLGRSNTSNTRGAG